MGEAGEAEYTDDNPTYQDDLALVIGLTLGCAMIAFLSLSLILICRRLKLKRYVANIQLRNLVDSFWQKFSLSRTYVKILVTSSLCLK